MSINAQAFCDDFRLPVGPRRVEGVMYPISPLRISRVEQVGLSSELENSIPGHYSKIFRMHSWFWDRILETVTLDLACEKYLLSLFNSSF